MKKALKSLVNFLAFFPFFMALASSLAVFLDPITWTYAPLLAYALPYMALFSLISTVLLFVVKAKKMALVNLVALLVACFVGKPYLGSGSSTERDGEITVLSFNVRHFDRTGKFDVPRELIRDSILQIFSESKAEIICLQEAYFDTKPNRLIYKDDVINASGANHISATKHTVSNSGRLFGNFIFSKRKIVSSGEIAFDQPEYHRGICHYADIQWDENQVIRVYNFHLASLRYNVDEYEFIETIQDDTEFNQQTKEKGKRIVSMFLDAAKRRSYEVKKLLEHAKKSPYPVIMCGDLNDTPTSYAYNQISSEYQDAFLQAGRGFGKTYAGKMPANRIDYIFFDSKFSANIFLVHPSVLSDHLAIIAELTIN